jgi:hypothetical protein
MEPGVVLSKEKISLLVVSPKIGSARAGLFARLEAWFRANPLNGKKPDKA